MDPIATPNETTPLTAGMATQAVIREHIVSTPDTCGGKPRIAGSRIQVKHLAIMHERQGMSPEDIVSEFPHLTLGRRVRGAGLLPRPPRGDERRDRGGPGVVRRAEGQAALPAPGEAQGTEV